MEYLGYAMLAVVAVVFVSCIIGLGLVRAAVVVGTSLVASLFMSAALLLAFGAA